MAEQRGRLAQVGLDTGAIDLIQRRAWEVMRQMPGIASSDRFLGAAYDIKSGIAGLGRQGVADFTEIAALAARASDSGVETQAKLFSQGNEVFRPSLPGMSDRQFAGAFGAMVTKGLSPHMRGNPVRDCQVQRPARSIPAHAGEPLHLSC